MKVNLLGLFCLIFPSGLLKNFILRMFGWKIGKDVHIGFSFLAVNNMVLFDNTYIGHLNFVKIYFLKMGKKAYIQNLNRVTGPLYLILEDEAAIGNLNTIKRAKHPVSWGRSKLRIGLGSKITSRHTLDCTRPIEIGEHSIIAGESSQLWTHGYIHNKIGKDRFRIDGSIKIGNNVYIGSASVINPGVSIANAITVGSHSVIAKPLRKSGLYVSQSLRYIPFDYQKSYEKYRKVKPNVFVEKVVQKQFEQ